MTHTTAEIEQAMRRLFAHVVGHNDGPIAEVLRDLERDEVERN